MATAPLDDIDRMVRFIADGADHSPWRMKFLSTKGEDG